MSLETRLAEELVRSHPERAAATLEKIGVEARLSVLGGASTAAAAAVVQRMSPAASREVLEALPAESAAEMLGDVELDVAARLLRRVDERHRGAIVAHLPHSRARSLGALLGFPEHSAGGLMDPDVLALPEDLTAREALDRVRENPAHARYNIYVVDRRQKLVGVLNLRELFLARSQAKLSDLMVPQPQFLAASADRAEVVSHPGWREVHSLPVVDDEGCYVGTVRYRTMRELEDALLGRGAPDSNTAAALGELFAAGAAGVLDAFAAQNPAARGSRP